MSSFDFTLYQDNTSLGDRPFVEIQAVKSRKNRTSIFIRSLEFTLLEGIIWDKHREYGMSQESKILYSDWVRIMEGFEATTKTLQQVSTTSALNTTLKLRNYNNEISIDALLADKKTLIDFIDNFVNWLKQHQDKKSYTMIIKDI